MATLKKYSEAFWGPDYISTAGFDVLSKHNSDQKKFLHDFEEYLRKRSKIEMEYCKSLGQLAKSMKDRQVIGAVDVAWNTLRGELDSCRQAHEESSGFFVQHAEEAKRFSKECVASRENTEDRLKKIQSQKNAQYKNVVSLNKTYRQKCQERDQLVETYHTMRRGVTSTVKELEKAKSKMEKTEEETVKADAAYKSGIMTLEETRQDWEKEMESACGEFQQWDEEQIMFIRSELWLAVNRTSQEAVDVDESCERVRKALEMCDINQDIQNFINSHSTGTERPKPIPYLNYDMAGQNSRTLDSSSRTLDSSSRLPMAPPSYSNNDSSAYYSVADSLDDPTYSSAEPIVDVGPRLLTISKIYQSSPDFMVQAGERVTFLQKVGANVVSIKTSLNKVGTVPVTCIKESI